MLGAYNITRSRIPNDVETRRHPEPKESYLVANVTKDGFQPSAIISFRTFRILFRLQSNLIK